MTQLRYDDAIYEGYRHLLTDHPEVFAIGQGVWSPWYVGNTMRQLEDVFGKHRVIDTPVSEQACTGVAIGAALNGCRPIISHPRVDFALLAMDQIVNQAAKWSLMFGGRMRVPITFRCIINRGGEQGAQHSQSLHSWFAHVPGLRVVMPYSPKDARDLLVASVLSDDPVLFIDDRWLYPVTEDSPPLHLLDLASEGPNRLRSGEDITLVGAGYSTHLCNEAAREVERDGISCDVIDVRVLNPLRIDAIVASVNKTRRLCVVDGDWRTCGLAGEIISGVVETIEPGAMVSKPVRLTLPDTAAPTSKPLEDLYYTSIADVSHAIEKMVL